MTLSKKNNLIKMKNTAKDKSGYGITQVNTSISSYDKILSDNKAWQGKQILQEKIYTK